MFCFSACRQILFEFGEYFSFTAALTLTSVSTIEKPLARGLVVLMVVMVSDNVSAKVGHGGYGAVDARDNRSLQGYRSKSTCFPELGYGPLAIQSQSPLQSLRLSQPPRQPATLRKGQLALRAAATWVNIYAEEKHYTLDYETIQPSLSLAYGLSEKWQFDLAFEQWSRFGGALDSISEGFHDFFGMDQNGRDDVGDGTFRFSIHAPGQQPVTLTHDGNGIYSRAVLTSLQYNATCGNAILPALSYAVTVRHHIGESDDPEGGNTTDVGVSIAAARWFGAFSGYLTLAYSRFGRDHFQSVELRRQQFSMLSALEWRWRATQSFFLQYHWTEGVADNLGSLSEASNEVVIGWKGELSRDTVIELGLIENVVRFYNSPDFGFHMGVNRRF